MNVLSQLITKVKLQYPFGGNFCPILSFAVKMEAEFSLKVSVIAHQIARCSNQLYTAEVSSRIAHPFEFPCTTVIAPELLVA